MNLLANFFNLSNYSNIKNHFKNRYDVIDTHLDNLGIVNNYGLPDKINITITDTWVQQKIEYKNRLIANPIVIGGGGGMGNAALAGDWWSIVQQMGSWYEQNVHTYQGNCHTRKGYSCPLLDGKNVFDDCSSFVTACVLALFKQKGGPDKGGWYGGPPSTAAMQPGSDWDRTLQSNGFKYIPFNQSILQPGDIYCGGPSTHVEICAGQGKQYGWGSVHDKIAKPGVGMPCSTYKSGFVNNNPNKPYLHIWRYGG